jgi:divalent metal cation (Fe/Co/Zn/Cd) transporter
MESRALALLRGNYPHIDWHNLRAQPCQGGINLMMHATLPSQISIESAHQIAEAAETLLRADMPHLERITIHTEPPDEVS